MMACVVGDGRGREGKRAPQAEGQYGAARRGTSGGPADGPGDGPGGGVAGYSRELLRGALIYAGRGIPVFPCEAQGKRPLTAEGFLEATTDDERIRRWWARWPNANVAISTGERSGLLVLDVDAGEGTDSVALLELSRGHPPRRRGPRREGGQHLFFRYPSPRELRAAGLYTQQVRNNQGLLGDGLDVRGEKGRVRRLRRGPARQHGASLPVAGSFAPAEAAWLLGCLRAATSGETLF